MKKLLDEKNTYPLLCDDILDILTLRVILIYECDLNFILGCKWREVIHKAQEEGTINEGQYGGCPGREPTSLTLLEELRIDYSMLTPEQIAQFDNDASSCYYRILVARSSLASRNLGFTRMW